jgi:hypothetical protein
MSALSQHTALLSVLSLPQGSSDAQEEEVIATVKKIMQEPGAYVAGTQGCNPSRYTSESCA